MADTTPNFDSLLIRASAGTGKTYELSTRYLSLLAAGEEADRILATTFTRKAAGEIRERVMLRLSEAVISKRAAGELGISQEKAATVFGRLIQSQHRLRICTLDSFFFQLATSFGFELGLIPGWTMADENANADLSEEAVYALCEEHDTGELATLLNLLSKGGAKRSVYERIHDEIPKLYELYRETEEGAWSWLEPEARTKAEDLTQAVRSLENVSPPSVGKNGRPNANWAREIDRAIAACAAGDWEDFVRSGLSQRILTGQDSYYGRAIPEEIKKIYQPLLRHARAEVLNSQGYKTQATRRLLEVFEREYLRLRRTSRTLGYSDVKHLLAEAALTDRMNDIYFRLDSRLAHLLLDEFQDTSRAEWRVLEPVADEILSKASAEQSFFCVGDVKQAIYGWRGGVAEIIDYIENRWSQVRVESREESRRSSQAVIDLINQVFSTLEDNAALAEHQQTVKKWRAGFRPHTTVHGAWRGYAAMYRIKTGSENGHPVKMAAETIASLIRTIRSSAAGVSVGILTRSNARATALVQELAQLPEAIVASEEGGNPLVDSAPVCSLLSLLRLADHPGDSVARYHVQQTLLSPLFGLRAGGPPDLAVKAARQAAAEIWSNGFGPALHSWVRRLWPLCNVSDRRRLQQLVTQGHRFDASAKSPRLMDFVKLIERTKLEDPGGSPVRVMTIHRAKGLEFDVVFLPELDGSIIRSESGGMMSWRRDPLSSAERVAARVAKEVRVLDPRLEAMHAQEVARQVSESLSVLYVALSRARHAVYLLVPDTGKGSSTQLSQARVLSCALGERQPPAGEVVFELGNPDWAKDEVECKDQEAEDHESNEPIMLAPLVPSRRRILKRESPSGLEGGDVWDVRGRLRLGSGAAAQRGTIIHALFAQVQWLDRGIPNEGALRKAAILAGATDENVKSYLQEFASMLANDEVSAILSASRWSKPKLFCEQGFAYRQEDNIIVGTFDRLVVETDGSRAEVIDFKSDRVSAESLPQAIEYYRPQLEAYRLAAERFSSISRERISGAIVFTSLGKVVPVF